ncbi:hypothetical protein AB0K60_17125 [Thermopolyspora sp. NPDC052614]|uniref:hypothetical protein n=1 Tax=Thermopolyspora sp. NPDC052614 TaxID=3155682 RepID=UPI003448C21B
MDLDEAADRLYGVAPAEFVAVREELRRRARESGDAALARAIAGLRKPTVAAWAVNQVARDHREGLDELLEVGERLRRAWRDQDAATLAELTARRSTVTGRLSRLVRRTAEERGQALSGAALNEVEQILDATVVDADAADQVRRGRLVRAPGYRGFAPSPGEAEKPAKKTDARAGAAEEGRAAGRERRREARQDAAEAAARAAAEAERGHAEWRAELARVEEEHRRQAELVGDLESRLADARERLRAVERRLGVVRRDEGKARREAAASRRRADEARRALKE